MPTPVRPDPPLPVNVAIAARAYGSEVRVALLAYYRENSGATQKAATEALRLEQSVVARHIVGLVEAGVLVADLDPADRRHRIYSVDVQRTRELLAALGDFILGS